MLTFLDANKEQYFLDDEDIDVIHKNKVAGLVFLQLTKEELLQKPFELTYGAATIIDHLRQELCRIKNSDQGEGRKPFLCL